MRRVGARVVMRLQNKVLAAAYARWIEALEEMFQMRMLLQKVSGLEVKFEGLVFRPQGSG